MEGTLRDLTIRLCALAVMLAVVFLGVGGAKAQDSKKASQLNKQAIAAYKTKAYLKAIDFWLQATDYADDEQLIKLHKNLGLAMQKLERPAEAWYHLTTYMKRSPETDGKVAKQVQELEKSLGTIHTRINVSTQPAGALAILPPGDRMHKLRTPFSWWLPPGEFLVEFQKEGYVTVRKTLRVEYGGNDQFDVVLEQQKRTGVLKLSGDADGSSVRLNGKTQGPLPFFADLKPGTYVVEVYYVDGRVWKTRATVVAGKTTELGVELATIKLPGSGQKQVRKASNAWKWATLAGGAVVAGVGGVLHGVGISNNNTRYDEVRDKWLDQGLAQVTSVNDAAYIGYVTEFNSVYDDDVKPFLTGAYVLYGIGGAAILTGAIALMIPESSKGEGAAFRLQPAVGAGQAGLDLSITF